MSHFCCENTAFFKILGHDLDLMFEKMFEDGWIGLRFNKPGLDLVRKICQSAHLWCVVSLFQGLPGCAFWACDAMLRHTTKIFDMFRML